jgi:hypothetical protein
MWLAGCGSSSSDSSVAKANAAAAKMNADIGKFLAIGPPSDDLGWPAFFDNGDKLIAGLRADFTTWSSLVDQAVASGHAGRSALTQSYRDALGVWLSDQEAQAHMTRGCFLGSATTDAARTCYAQMLATYGTQWQADASKVNALMQSSKLGS